MKFPEYKWVLEVNTEITLTNKKRQISERIMGRKVSS